MTPSDSSLNRSKTRKIEIVSHRGANEHAPENTFAAAQICIDLGVDIIEVDVWTSRDGVLYVMHDSTVDRTTDGTGHLLALTSAEIDRLDAGSWFDPDFTGERVPRLEEFLRWVKGKAKVFFDVKFAHPQHLIDLIHATGMAEACFLWSGSDGWMQLCHALAPELPLKVNVSSADDVVNAHEKFSASIVEVSPENLNAELIETCRQLGIKVMVHTQRDTAEVFRQVLCWDIDMVNLDRPDLFQQILTSLQ